MQNNNYSSSLKSMFPVNDLALITCPEELECPSSLISWTPLSANLVPNTCTRSPWQGTAYEHQPKIWSLPSPDHYILRMLFCVACVLPATAFPFASFTLEQPTHCLKLSTAYPSSVSAPAFLLVAFIPLMAKGLRAEILPFSIILFTV